MNFPTYGRTLLLGLFFFWLLPFASLWANLLENCSAATPTGCITKNTPGRVESGYTFIDNLGLPLFGFPGEAELIDVDGNLIHTWRTGGWSKMLPNGHVLTSLYYSDWRPIRQFLDCLVELDWDGNPVWPVGAKVIDIPGAGKFCDETGTVITTNTDASGRPVTYVHHDHQRKNNPVGYYAPGQTASTNGGTTLVMFNTFPDLADSLHVSDIPLVNDNIIEYDSDGSTVLWQWDPLDHFNAGQGSAGDLGLGFSAIARLAIRTIPVPHTYAPLANRSDWLHSNSAAYLGKNNWCPDPNSAACDLRFHPDNVLWNSREANIFAIIARYDHPDGDWLSGDIVWRVGPDFTSTPGKLDQTIGAHMVYMIPQGLQGAGNILLFDNGGAAGFGGDSNGNPIIHKYFRPYSRVIEFDPNTLDVIWSYERPSAVPIAGENFAPFASGFLSSAQRLKNGNTLIAEGGTGRVFEVDRFGELLWEFVSPFGPWPPGGQGAPFGNIVYRAYRVPSNWVPNSITQLSM